MQKVVSMNGECLLKNINYKSILKENMNKKCPFCNINKVKTRIIENGNHCFVILSNPRLMPGHLLIIPKRHVEKLSELSNSELADLLKFTVKYQEKIIKNIASGCDVRQNYRPFIKDGKLKVAHLHFHLQPRWPDVSDELFTKCQKYEIELFKPLTDDEKADIEKLLEK